MGRILKPLIVTLVATSGMAGLVYSFYTYEESKVYPKIEGMPMKDKLNESKRIEIEVHDFRKKWKEHGGRILKSYREESKKFKENLENQDMDMPAEGKVILDIINDNKLE
ncbi:unnamed protein product [Blepharisma stoltei]|uniref:Uncharacterized protein n=1 Tax=Blepharisma stoltei TaxID=1481888 RepID=A0AAU9IJX8_9CILI|nr:unnamed protein product [Blepharisma stoltei]